MHLWEARIMHTVFNLMNETYLCCKYAFSVNNYTCQNNSLRV